MKRSLLREKIMVILYQLDIAKDQKLNVSIDDTIKANVEVENEFVKQVVYGCVTYKDKIDNLANKYMNDWSIDRIDKTGAAILRMAIYELMYTDTPEVVVINEAIELSKKYSDDNVRKIINAVLDKIIKDR
ncbi:MAG: transcription antitermination factor NusB [Mycoplasma sp.]|jgi:N utilization substance protein B|nr:transcription antitermination factor NusB [Mycoplasma sp.]MDY4544559.1 transcription antitermination factor NusB [Bacilli bacterium]MDY4619057.1 transcription antitermination factor NusB [Bacilli bacterium]